MPNQQDREEIHPEVIRLYTTRTLAQQGEAAIQIRAALTPEPHKTTLILEGSNLYSAGVRAVYTALSIITLQGRSGQVDVREIEALKQGIEDYLIPRER